MTQLISVRAKVARANQHIQAAKEVSKAFLDTEFYRFAVRPQKNGNNRHFIIIKKLEPIPDEFGLLIGDAAHNLRSALDHIAYAFAKPSNWKEEKKVAFPLCSKRSEFRARAPALLPGISRKVMAAVQRAQPYHGGKGSKTKALGQIQAINNWDKHRSMLVAAVGSPEVNFTAHTLPPTDIVSFRIFAKRPFKLGTIICRFQLAESKTKPKMSVTGKLKIHIVFADGMPKEVVTFPVFGILARASKFIDTELIPTFEKFL